MLYRRMPIEAESPEEYGYDTVSCNLAESSVSDVPLEKIGADFSKLSLSYGDHRGLPELRSLLAADAPGLSADDMLVTPGAAAALFFLHTALLEKGDHLIVIHPNYATNLETPYAIGCEISKIDLRFEEGFRLDPARIREAIRPGTKLISITSPHNPTGIIIPQETIKDLAALAAEKGCKLLVDETYRELAQGIVPQPAATLGPQVITVSSVSKAYGIPGLRIGWIMCSDKTLMQTLLAAKEQVIICNSVLDEALVCEVMRKKKSWLEGSLKHVARNREILFDWFSGMSDRLEFVPPQGGVVCLPRIRKEIKTDTGTFYSFLYREMKTMVGPGHWFGMDDRYFRLGYGWPGEAEFTAGLANIEKALKTASS